jgi:mannosylglycerate hydrolase
VVPRAVAVVPHTHWDREWYVPFETYRERLIRVLDDVVGLLESGRLPHFHLDGQVAAVDDYLEACPERSGRVAALVASGRLAVGPWYVPPDQFCVSAETLVRNLQSGWERARELGAERFCGYLPDVFGQVAQMPQILAQAGLSHAVVWRGVPAAISRRSFRWVSPDGSGVRAEYLPAGYAAGAFLPQSADDLLRRLEAHEAEVAGFLGPAEPLLLMNGGDHHGAQAWVPDLLEEANHIQDRFQLRIVALAEFLAGAPEAEGCWAGELRSGARAPLLPGVLSARGDIKQAAAAAETALERQAEPLATLWLPPPDWPERALAEAWRAVVLSSAHDSVCGCSADPVGRAVLARYDRARALAGHVLGAAEAVAGVATAEAGWVVLNPLPADRDGLVELELPGCEPPAGTQVLAVRPATTVERSGRGGDLGRLLGELTAAGVLGLTGKPERVELAGGAGTGGAGGMGAVGVVGATGTFEGGAGATGTFEGGAGGALVVTLHSDPASPPDPASAAVMAEAWARAGAGRERPLTVRVRVAPTQRVLARSGPVPGFGWRVWRDPGAATGGPPAVGVCASAVTASGTRLANGLIEVGVDATGLVDLSGPAGSACGLNRLVEEPDGGDTYNFCGTGPARDRPDRVELALREHGPLRGVLRVVRHYAWARVVSDIEVQAGSPVVRFRTCFDHHGRDHRIRAVFPLPAPAEVTRAECAFAAVERGRPEGGPAEPESGAFPSRRFVSAGGLTVFHSGLLEYELVDDGRALALTLLRAVGVLARPSLPSRPVPAGPAVPTPDAQLLGPRRFAYAAALGVDDPWSVADDLGSPLRAVRAEGGGPLPRVGSRLEVDLGGACFSSLRRHRGGLELRVFNPHRYPVTVGLPGRAGSLVELTGAVVARWAERFELPPGRFATARLDQPDLDARP